MREGWPRIGLRKTLFAAMGVSLALTANDPTLAQPQPRQTTPARSPAVSGPPSAAATAHAVACTQILGRIRTISSLLWASVSRTLPPLMSRPRMELRSPHRCYSRTIRSNDWKCGGQMRPRTAVFI